MPAFKNQSGGLKTDGIKSTYLTGLKYLFSLYSVDLLKTKTPETC